MLLGDNELEAALQKVGQMSASNTVDEKEVNADFQSAISQVLKDLTANSENLQVILSNLYNTSSISIMLKNKIIIDNSYFVAIIFLISIPNSLYAIKSILKIINNNLSFSVRFPSK